MHPIEGVVRYNTESLIMNHTVCLIWRMPCSLHTDDIWCRFGKTVENHCEKLIFVRPYPTPQIFQESKKSFYISFIYCWTRAEYIYSCRLSTQQSIKSIHVQFEVVLSPFYIRPISYTDYLIIFSIWNWHIQM